jgi:hypothetical protein
LQQLQVFVCPFDMARDAKRIPNETPNDRVDGKVYELDTPRWRQYYLAVRKTIRFPRYYKKTENW